jgi:superfamily II DNA helicase RecQ
LVLHKPGSLHEMAGISGIGQTKIERYGEVFLDVISRHRRAA